MFDEFEGSVPAIFYANEAAHVLIQNSKPFPDRPSQNWKMELDSPLQTDLERPKFDDKEGLSIDVVIDEIAVKLQCSHFT